MSLPIVDSLKVCVSTFPLLEKYIRIVIGDSFLAKDDPIAVLVAPPRGKPFLPEHLQYIEKKRFPIFLIQTQFCREHEGYLAGNTQSIIECSGNQAATAVDSLIVVLKDSLNTHKDTWLPAFRSQFREPDIDGDVEVGYRLRTIGNTFEEFALMIQFTYFEYHK